MAFKRLNIPPQRDHAACAIFGAIATNGNKVPLKSVIKGICIVEHERGGIFGNGIGFADDVSRTKRGKTLSLLATDSSVVSKVERDLISAGIPLENSGFSRVGTGIIYECLTTAEYLPLVAAVAAINAKYSNSIDYSSRGSTRIILYGHGMHIFKGLSSLRDLADTYQLSNLYATAAIAHTRFPTGSGAKEVGAHPHAFGNVIIVHNGDVTSYPANLAACTAKLAQLVYRQFGQDAAKKFLEDIKGSWVGTDSEVISAMIYSMLKHGAHFEPGLSIPAIIEALSPPFDNDISSLRRNSRERDRFEGLLKNYAGYQLDGPVSCIALMTVEDDVHLIFFRDRNAFRPGQIVVDREQGVVYVASELRQIINATGINIFDMDIESYHLDHDHFLWVSANSGIQRGFSGRIRRPFIPALEIPKDARYLCGFPNCLAGEEITGHRATSGTLGNFGMSFAYGPGVLEHFGSVQDNVMEGCRLDTVIIHGNCSQMTGNAFQGRRLFIRGAVDCRAVQQLRPGPYGKPTVIIGETAGLYLAKMMSAGRVFVLGLSWLGKEDIMPELVGPFAATGAVGGTLYVRGSLYADKIGLAPERRAVIAMADALSSDKIIDESQLPAIRHAETALDFELLSVILKDKPKALERFRILFDFHFDLPVDRRCLTSAEKEHIRPEFEEYVRIFNLPPEYVDALLRSSWTIISAGVK